MRIFTILIGVLLLVGCESKINHINTVYIFNDKTQLWDRARLDDLKNAKCERPPPCAQATPLLSAPDLLAHGKCLTLR